MRIEIILSIINKNNNYSNKLNHMIWIEFNVNIIKDSISLIIVKIINHLYVQYV